MKEKQTWPRRRGWKQLRREDEIGFTPDFKPLRSAMQRNEFFGSVVELFFSALVGVGKLNLGAEKPQADTTQSPESDQQSHS